MGRMGQGEQSPDQGPISRAELCEIYSGGLGRTPEAVAISTPEGQIVQANGSAHQLLLYAPDELLGMSTSEVWADPRDRARMLEQMGGSGSVVGRARLRRKDGEIRDWYVAGALVPLEARTFVFWLGHDVTGQRRTENEIVDLTSALRAANDERRRLVALVIHAVEQGRDRLVSEVNDGVVQQLTAAQLRLRSTASRVSPELRGDLRAVEESLTASMSELRDVMREFRGPVLERGGLVAATRRALQELEAAGAFTIELDGDVGSDPSADIATLAYRVIHETLVDIRDRGRADHVGVHLDRNGDEMSVVIRDDGPASQEEVSSGNVGSQVLQALVRSAGGSFDVTSGPDGRTVSFTLPTSLTVGMHDF
jgi:PAS domain S-box-containing protein